MESEGNAVTQTTAQKTRLGYSVLLGFFLSAALTVMSGFVAAMASPSISW